MVMEKVNRRSFFVASAMGAGILPAQTGSQNPQTFPAGVVPGGRPRASSAAAGSTPTPGAPPATSAARIEYFWKACDECVELGVHNVEVNTTSTQLAQTYITRISEFRDEMSRRGLRLVGLAMYAHLHERNELSAMIEQHLLVGRFLQAVGGRYIAELIAPAAHLGNGDDESYRRVDVKAVIANCNEIGKRVREETGIQMGYHPEQGDVRAGIWDKIVDATDDRYYNFWPDVGHLTACGVNPMEAYKKYRARMVGTHLRDYAPAAPVTPGGPPARGRMVPFGEGIIDLQSLVRFLRETKFTGCVMGEGGGGTRAMRDYMTGILGLRL
jgi:sugar phosphate isomerase/epimerase